MSFSTEWENIYKENKQMSIWPWAELISYVMRFSKPTSSNFKILELGCGAGANIPFFLNLNIDYYALEGSPSVIDYLIQKFPSLSERIKVADFTKNIPFDTDFDLIVDRSSLTHNDTDTIKNCISLISKHLKINGKFIGIDWFSTTHSEFKNGSFTKDLNTKDNFPDGQFHKVGQVHFSDGSHIRELFKDFEFIKLDHKVITQEYPEKEYLLASYNFAIKKIK